VAGFGFRRNVATIAASVSDKAVNLSEHRTTSVGFTLLYCALMAALIIATTHT
jgi:hypothetical protein